MENIEMSCFQIISNVGMARSSYIEAIHKARQGDFEGAENCIKDGEEQFLAGHHAHLDLLQRETQGENIGSCLILIHAEDQLMSAENFKIIAQEMIEDQKLIRKLLTIN